MAADYYRTPTAARQTVYGLTATDRGWTVAPCKNDKARFQTNPFARKRAYHFYSLQLTYLRVLPLMTISSITVPMMIRPRMMDCQFALIPIILIPL